jgi:hypothetical protein
MRHFKAESIRRGNEGVPGVLGLTVGMNKASVYSPRRGGMKIALGKPKRDAQRPAGALRKMANAARP